MGQRLQLQSELEAIQGNDHVYFQPPPTIKMAYPCIVYSRSAGKTAFASNYPYTHQKQYTVTVITKDPDSDTPDKVAAMKTCVFNRHFVGNNLNHFVYNLFY